MVYKILDKRSNTYVNIGYQEEVSDGEVYTAYYYIHDFAEYPDIYDTFEEANDILICACYDGMSDIQDYEIVEVV